MTDSLKIRKLIDTQTPGLIRVNGKEMYLNREMLKKIKKLEQKGGMIGDKYHSGGLLPLAALLPLIFAGVTAAGATAASISKTVSNAREAQKNQAETEKIRQETANITPKAATTPTGSGLKGKKGKKGGIIPLLTLMPILQKAVENAKSKSGEAVPPLLDILKVITPIIMQSVKGNSGSGLRKKGKKGKGIEDEDDYDDEDYEEEDYDEDDEDEGEGLYLDDYTGKGIQKIFREQINQTNKDKKSKNKLLARNRKLGGKLKCRFTGKGLYLEPWDPNSRSK